MASPFIKVTRVQHVIRDQYEITMQLYCDQVYSGQNRNQETMVSSTHPASFGTIVINDWRIHDALPDDPNSTVVAHARGMHVQADQATPGWYTSMNIEFVDGSFKGSKLQVMGTTPDNGEWAIVGGTGELSMAYGIIEHKMVKHTIGSRAIRELNVRAFYSPNTAPAGAVNEVSTEKQAE